MAANVESLRTLGDYSLIGEHATQAVQKGLDGILYPLGLMLTGKTGPLNAEQRQALASANAAAQRLSELVVREIPGGQ